MNTAERGRFQRVVDTVAEFNREHQGTVAGGTVFLAGAGAAVAKVEVAPIAIAVGTITVLISSGVDYVNNVIGRNMPKEIAQSPLPPGFHEAETTIVSAEEIQSALTANVKESQDP